MNRDLSSFAAEPQWRAGVFGAVDKEKRTIELSFSSDIELERWPGMVEVLSHDPGAVMLDRLNSGGPLLFNHDLDEVIGVVESATVGADRKGRAVVRFGNSEEAQEVWADVQDGILRNVSVGYRIKEIKLDESREGGPDVYLVTKWEPYEVSIVSVPADTSVGVGRSLEIAEPQTIPKKMDTEIDLIKEREIAASAASTAERDRVRSILSAGSQYKESELATEFATAGRSLEEFRVALLEKVDAKNRSIVEASKPIGLSEKESQSFSFLKLFRALAAESGDAKKFGEEAKFELEACQAAASKMHRSTSGVVVPVDVMLSPLTRSGEVVSVKSGSGYISTGANAVPTNLLSGSFIEVLRNRAVLMQLAQELSGLVGNVDIPKQTDASTATWVGEDTAGTRQAINFGLVSLRPHTVTNYAEITRRMMMQTAIGVEALVRYDLAAQLARTIDLAGFYGDGQSNAPTGIKNTAGIKGFSFGAANAPTFAELVRMETEIALSNADVPSMTYVANAGFRGYAKTARRLATATDSNTIWEPGNTVNGYRTEITNQVATGDVFFGNWSDLLVGMWGGLEVTVDPYTFSTQGRIRIVLMQDLDFAVRRAASFAFCSNPA